MKTITMEQLQLLTRIYNTLLTIETKGENTLIMADSLRALEQTIVQISQGQDIEDENEESSQEG